MNPEIHIQVTVIEPGWAVVHYEGPKPFKYEQYHWLDMALHGWLKQFPQYILQRVMPIEHDGQVVGLNAWFSAANPPQEQFSFNVAPEVRAVHAQEYLEAVMTDVTNFMRFGTFPSQHVAVVNRRGIATIVSRSGTQGVIVGREQLETMLNEQSRKELSQWLEHPKTTLFIVTLPEEFEPPTIQG